MSDITTTMSAISGTITTINATPNVSTGIASQILGAALAIAGGFFAVIFRLRIERKSEIKHIKISLVDEIDEICAIIGKMRDTYNATTPHIISNTYLTDLSKNTESFLFHKQKFYLISKAELRKEIHAFYKELDKNVADSINTVGQLGTSGSLGGNQDSTIVSNFAALAITGATIKGKIIAYKYHVLWYNS